ncbi:hypothetical protein DL93DRAFT_2082805 [Clavulina sp. PMI_390]|nr:hypothetical protein DL93DRAFT_2082805 [Clavulina sp. PMI_390]
MVIRLSHVCSSWRSLVLGTRVLFTEADWSKWPIEALVQWCYRAGTAPLSIRINQNTLIRISHAVVTTCEGTTNAIDSGERSGAARFLWILESCLSRFSAIHFEAFTFSVPLSKSLVLNFLFGSRLESLELLAVGILEQEPIFFPLDAPRLQQLYIDTAVPQIACQLPHLSTLSVALYSSRLQDSETLLGSQVTGNLWDSAPNVANLVIEAARYRITRQDIQTSSFPAITTLTLNVTRNVELCIQALQKIELVNLQSICIAQYRNRGFRSNDVRRLLHEVTTMHPSITTISCTSSSRGIVPTFTNIILELLDPSIVPNLQRLTVNIDDNRIWYPFVPLPLLDHIGRRKQKLKNALIAFSRKRGNAKLCIPNKLSSLLQSSFELASTEKANVLENQHPTGDGEFLISELFDTHEG